jgi:hypothetical protein
MTEQRSEALLVGLSVQHLCSDVCAAHGRRCLWVFPYSVYAAMLVSSNDLQQSSELGNMSFGVLSCKPQVVNSKL